MADSPCGCSITHPAYREEAGYWRGNRGLPQIPGVGATLPVASLSGPLDTCCCLCCLSSPVPFPGGFPLLLSIPAQCFLSPTLLSAPSVMCPCSSWHPRRHPGRHPGHVLSHNCQAASLPGKLLFLRASCLFLAPSVSTLCIYTWHCLRCQRI